VNCLVYDYLSTINTKLAEKFKNETKIICQLPPGSPAIADVVKHFDKTNTTNRIKRKCEITEDSLHQKKTKKESESGKIKDESSKEKKKKTNKKSEEKTNVKLVSTENRRIFIKNLGKKFVYEDFKEKVDQFGEVTKFLNSGRGFCFLTYSTAAAATACIAALNNTKVAGKTLQMNIAKEKPTPSTAPTPTKDTFTKRVEGCTLFVNGVKQKTATCDLTAAFEQFGEVTDSLNSGKGFAFVTFATPVEASNAMVALNGSEVCGTTISIEVSKEGGKAWTGKKEVGQENVRLFVNNVSKDTSIEDLRAAFSVHGHVKDTQHSGKGFAFVSFASAKEAQAAVKSLNGQKVGGQIIECNIAKVQKGRKRRKLKREKCDAE